MKAKIKYKLGGSHETGDAEIRNITIMVDGTRFTITHSPVYGLIVNKIDETDNGRDTIIVSPRTSNEIQLK